MSARCPAATWKPLAATQPAKIKPEIVCVHTIVGSMASTWNSWKPDGYKGLESTFMVGGKWGNDGERGLDGVAWQVADADSWSDANYEGSHRLISIETGDNASKSAADIQRWTPKQATKLVEVIAWCCTTYDIPPVLVPDSKPGRRGLAYHRIGIDPWRVAGGEKWSLALGKECPGPARIKQFINEIIPAVKARIEEDDMPTPQDIANEVWNSDRIPVIDPKTGKAPLGADGKPNPTWQADSVLAELLAASQRTEARLAAIEAKLPAPPAPVTPAKK